MIGELGKYEDAGVLVQGGRIDKHWLNEIDIDTQQVTDENIMVFQPFLLDTPTAQQHFNLRSIEYGNWMNQEDRGNFLYGAMLSLFHLSHLFGVPAKAVGLNKKLSIALGARGKGGAAAHYEATPHAVINITKTKGFGAFAHEYGHAIDNIISYYTRTQQKFASGGRSTRKRLDADVLENGNYFEQQFELLLNTLFWEEDGSKTSFHQNIEILPEYWNRRNEVFARTFEAYITYLMNEKGWTNHFLSDSNYSTEYYPSTELLEKVEPLIQDIIRNAFQLFDDNINLSGLTSRTTIKRNASLSDTLTHMKHIVLRDYTSVSDLAFSLKGNTVAQTSENIWNWMRLNTKYKLDTKGIEELRTPLRSLKDKDSGIDCDDYTILISSILLNLNIPHQFRIAAYKNKGNFQHIYPVAFDDLGNEYVIDVVPEIPHFNFEAQPIKDLKTLTIMELQELSGLDQEAKNELLEQINEPFSLSGIEEDEQDDSLLDYSFLQGLKEVHTAEEADIVLDGAADIANIIERGILAEINKAKTTLANESNQPTVLSQTINVAAELSRMKDLMNAFEDEAEREDLLNDYIRSNSSYKNFYKAILLSLNELDADVLNGLDDEDPIYLAKADTIDLSKVFDESVDGLGRFRLKNFFKKIGKGIKKVVKAVVKYNPATMAIRGATLLILKTNMFKIASRLIYGYLTKEQAQEKNLDLNEWQKLVNARKKAEKFYTKLGGKSSKFKKAVVKGRAAKKTGLQLGAVATGTAVAGSGFIAFMKKILSAINPMKLFKKKNKNKEAKGKTTNTTDTSTNTDADFNETDFDPNNDTPSMRTANTNEDGTSPNTTFMQKAKNFFTVHKKKIMIVGVGGVVALVSLFAWNKYKQKQKRSIAGLKGARTRKRNAKKSLGGTRRKRPALRGSTTIIKVPTKSIKKARASRRSNGDRLSLMHKKAKQLQKKHPNTKYSNLMKKAAKLI